MTRKLRVFNCALASAMLIGLPAFAGSAPAQKPHSAMRNAPGLRILDPKPGMTWYFSSKQVVAWSLSGLPEGNYSVVGFLKSLEDGKKGEILEDSAGNGRAQANYVVNQIAYGEETYSLKNGKYVFSLALYRKPDPGHKGLGELILEKKGGVIRIEGSDVGMRPDYRPIPDDSAGM